MPTRLIRQGINDSGRVDQLDWAAEVFYRRLLNVCDDHGLYDARAAKLRADLFPLRLNRVREADIARWSAECAKAGLIVLYEADGKPFLKVLDTRWQARSQPKYPVPPERPFTTENNCKQLCTNAGTDSYAHSDSETGNVDPPVGGGVPSSPAGFLRFWAEWPSGSRKQGKPKCLDLWVRRKLETIADQVIDALKLSKTFTDWTKDGGAYVPMPMTWLNRAPWETDPTEMVDQSSPDAQAKRVMAKLKERENVAQ